LTIFLYADGRTGNSHLLAGIRNSKHTDHEVLKRYESVGGVRIEDVVVITDRVTTLLR